MVSYLVFTLLTVAIATLWTPNLNYLELFGLPFKPKLFGKAFGEIIPWANATYATRSGRGGLRSALDTAFAAGNS